MNNTYVIGVCGGSCSGKTTICQKIISILECPELDKNNDDKNNDKNQVIVLSQDSYYYGGNSDTNYDIPTSINFKRMEDDIKKLINKETIEGPIYDFATHSILEQTKTIKPARVIIIEGILIFTQESIRNLCNLKIFVSAYPELMYSRRLNRDIIQRNRNQKEIQDRYFKHVLPSLKQYVEPTENFSDIVLKNNTENEFIGLTILLDHISKIISCD